MASTQKKTTSSKSKPAEKKAGTKKPEAKTRKGPPIYVPNMVARGVGAAVCIFLAVMLGLGMFGAHAVVVDFLCHGVKGLVGYGFWVAVPVLLAAAVLLLAKRQKSVRLRLWYLGLFPVFLGAFVHLLLSPYPYQMAFSTFAALWRDGLNLFSGGVLGGFLSISFATWFSPIGAGILFVLVMLVLLAGIFRVTPAGVFAYLRESRARKAEYDRYEDDYDDYGEEPYEEELPPPARQSEPFWAPFLGRKAPRRKAADIPLDEPEQQKPVKEPEPVQSPREKTREEEAAGVLKGTKGSFFSRKTHVKRPDEVLEELAGEEEDVITFDDPLPDVTPREETKAQRQEAIRQETDKVTRTIEKTVEEEPKAYQYPPLDILTPPSGDAQRAAHEELEGTLNRLASVLTSFGIDGHVTGAVQGPSVTRYEVALEQGVRLNKLTNLSDDVALALGVSNVRIAPVPGKISVVGVEVPNKVVTPVPIREVLDSDNFRRHKSSAAFSVGKDIGGNYIVGDCAKLPHMLIAGTTGSGKSVCINSLIVSMLYKSTPEELRLIMVDPKMVELGGYNGIPHLLIPVVTDPKKAAGALQWSVVEMMKRYRLFSENGVRDISGYNEELRRRGEATLPNLVIVIDELADLMMTAAKEVEESICRVAQMGRAAGVHLVIATQRPSADVITGLMKANIPSRIAFAVASSLESRIILDITGAEKLVGRGDMLYFPLGSGKPTRVQGCLISDQEVAAVVDFVKKSGSAQYDDDVMQEIEQHAAEKEKGAKGVGGSAPEDVDSEYDELIDAAAEVVVETGQASVSMLQRRLKLGYARAARLVDQLEEKGIVGPFEGSKPRQLLITKEQWQELKYRQGIVSAPTGQPQAAPVPAEPDLSDAPPFDVEEALDRTEEDTL